jgi:tetratricopeptide (TPR) repeat protein
MCSRESVFRVLICFGALVAAGCAHHRPPSFKDQVLRGLPGKNEDLAPSTSVPHESLHAYIQRVKGLAAAAAPSRSNGFQPSVESQSPELTAALLRLRVDPTAASNRAVGEAYRAAGVLDAAHRYLSRTLELDPTDARAFDARARIWRDWGYPNLALGDAYRAVYYAPDSPEAYNTLGTLFQALGQRVDARAAYRRALTLNPDAAYALNNLCYLSLLEGKGNDAIGECDSALKLAPKAAGVRNNLGLAYASLGDLQSARREFSAAGSKARAAYNLGISQLAIGRYTAAESSFQQAFTADPKLYLAQIRAAEARRRAGAAGAHQEEPDHGRE